MKPTPTILLMPVAVCALWTTACDSDGPYTLRIEPADPQVVVDPAAATTPIGFRALATNHGTGEVEDVTSAATWRIETPKATAPGALGGDGTFTPAGIGGRATIAADWNQHGASTSLTLMLHAEVFLDGIDEDLAGTFDTATPDTSAITIEYPDDDTVVPSNLPPLELQWNQVDDNYLYRVLLRSPDILDVTIYTRHRETIPSADLWERIGDTTADEPMTLLVEGVGLTGLARTSPERTLIITADELDPRPIYTHGTLGRGRAFDPITGEEWDLPSDAPALQNQSDPYCNGCHHFSPDGSRASYMRRVIGAPSLSLNEHGVLRYDAGRGLYTETIAPAPEVWGGLTAFNPAEHATAPAMLIQVPDPARYSTLALIHPDTGAMLPSNLADVLEAGPAAGQALLFPDWSLDGRLVVFNAYDPQQLNNFVGEAPFASILECVVSYDSSTGAFTFGPPTVLVSRTTGDLAETDMLPAINHEASAVAFVRGTSQPSDSALPGTLGRHVVIVRRSDGALFELAGSRGPAGADWSSSMPRWAPTSGSKYTWILFSSRRSYGHVFEQAGPIHLWVAAVDRAELASGTENPTRPAFFLRGQVLTEFYLMPQWPGAPMP